MSLLLDTLPELRQLIAAHCTLQEKSRLSRTCPLALELAHKEGWSGLAHIPLKWRPYVRDSYRPSTTTALIFGLVHADCVIGGKWTHAAFKDVLVIHASARVTYHVSHGRLEKIRTEDHLGGPYAPLETVTRDELKALRGRIDCTCCSLQTQNRD